MTELQIEKALDELVSLTLNGKWETAFEKFYHDDLEKTDLEGITVKGKAENLLIGKSLASSITEVRDYSCAGKLVKGNRSFLVWSLDLDIAGAGHLKVVEVAIQDWQDGKIFRERFIA